VSKISQVSKKLESPRGGKELSHWGTGPMGAAKLQTNSTPRKKTLSKRETTIRNISKKKTRERRDISPELVEGGGI